MNGIHGVSGASGVPARNVEVVPELVEVSWRSLLGPCPGGDGVGIVALRDHRVLALVVLTVDDGRVVHVEALAGEAPRAAVSRALGLAPSG